MQNGERKEERRDRYGEVERSLLKEKEMERESGR